MPDKAVREKSSVSALHEYCAKRKIPLPTFTFCLNDTKGHDCEVEMDGLSAYASGRSKRDAKHLAAANMFKKLHSMNRVDEENMASVPAASSSTETITIPNTDLVGALRDYCVLKNHPLPVFDMVQQGGTPDTPEFTIMCAVASIKRYGVSDKKKDARQKAAFEILKVIMEEDVHLDSELQITPIDGESTPMEEERYIKFKTYRELTDAKGGEVPGCLLADRHYYYTKFYDHMKEQAMKIIKDPTYESDKTKALDLLCALRLKPTITRVKTTAIEPLFLITLNCEYDTVFAGNEDMVYKDIINYFQHMLY